MNRENRFPRAAMLWALLVACPATAFAQAGIAGSVKDVSGAVLPGVTVEAASPALIEKTRTALTDGTGQYKIVDLRPGTYTVTFSLVGFTTFKRDGIELSGSFVATVNGELKVGSIEESITVSGETPVVDVQTVKTQQVLSSDVLTAIPTARNYQNLHVLVPGVTVAAGNQDVGGAAGDVQVSFSAHGGDFHDSHVLVNGLSVAAPQTGGGRTMYVPNAGSSQEVSVTTSAGLAESDTAGVTVNVVGKDGGNTFRGSLFATGTAGWMIGSNYDQALKDAGLRAPNTVKNAYDYEGTLGGPIIRDKLWFFAQSRYHGNANYIAGMFNNLNAGNRNVWTYAPGTTQAVTDAFWLDGSGRLTWQATPRNKFTAYYEDALRCTNCYGGGSPTASPETSGKGATHPNGLSQVTWTSPYNNRLLFEAGIGLATERWGSDPRPGFDPTMIPVSAQNGSIPGLLYRGPAIPTAGAGGFAKSWIATYSSRASLTYTSGSHSVKVGYTGEAFNYSQDAGGVSQIQYRFTTPDPGGIPNQVTVSAQPYEYYERVNNWGLFAQDQWTLSRLTLGYGVRYDRFTAFFPASTVGPSTFMPTPLTFAAVETTRLSDIVPRLTAAYDVRGDGKTAVKLALGKYVLSQSSEQLAFGGKAAPLNRVPLSYNRAWTDSNGDRIVDCNLLNLAAQNLSGSGGDVCGVASNLAYGQPTLSTQLDPDLFNGWGNRPYNWEFSAAVQHEILPRLSVNVAYFRRWYGNFVVTNNLALAPSDYDFFDFPVNDPRLPNNGQTVTGFFDVNPAKFGQSNLISTKASNFGEYTQHWNGLDVGLNARLRELLLQGGVSTGRQSWDFCEVARNDPFMLSTAYSAPSQNGIAGPLGFCAGSGAFQTQVKLLGSYTVPRIDVQMAATLQNLPGQEIQAQFAAPNATVAPLLPGGRNLSSCPTPVGACNQTTTLNLLPPQQNFSPRVNQVDFRVAKVVRFAGKRTQVTFDLYNALNSNVVQTYNPSFSPTGSWRIPTAILPARLAKISAQLDF